MKRNLIWIIGGIIAVAIIWQVVSPARFWINLFKQVDLSDPPLMGEQLVQKYDCWKCHMIAGEGALKAQDLSGVTQRLDETSLRLWLENPRALDRRTAMPNFRLSDAEITAIIAYLKKIDGEEK